MKYIHIIRIAGFSLVELMVVIAIAGVLAVISGPIYKDYVLRSKVSSAISILTGYHGILSAKYYEFNQFPTDGNELIPGSILIDSLYTVSADFGNSISEVSYGYVDNNHAYLRIGFSNTSPETDLQSKYIFYAARAQNSDLMEYACGIWQSGDAISVSLEILPSTCNTEIYTFLGLP